jgi:hypothetical protein
MSVHEALRNLLAGCFSGPTATSYLISTLSKLKLSLVLLVMKKLDKIGYHWIRATEKSGIASRLLI